MPVLQPPVPSSGDRGAAGLRLIRERAASKVKSHIVVVRTRLW